MKNRFLYYKLVAATLLLAVSCRVDPEIGNTKSTQDVKGITFSTPSGWPEPNYNFQSNPLTDAGFKLGRKLFYETQLSRDNTISCASCHQNFAAFAHSGHSLSHGIDGLFGTRNAPALFNLNWHPNFMHDGGINHIEVQPLAPITNSVEMDQTMEQSIAKLEKSATYLQLFKDAFGDATINSQRIFRAITQFQGMLISSNSKYDKHMRSESGSKFTEAESRGMKLFTEKKCASCHVPPLFTDFSFRNNGLSYNTTLQDSGRAHVTGLAADRNKFKTPSLRNITLTGPYMHDGRFNSLYECVSHYAFNILQTENLDPLLKEKITMTQQDIQDIIEFLGTLRDNQFASDDRFKDPN